ncbi:hypothetical protein [Rhodococcus marinonascens]|uniref:hypothetical protein n=1 Tax=Rhodococcus marinonascens TaxID=38311 RepID=UPI000AA684AF|nr:hypothetical protein [Rhodococcus marinonascens]
MYGMLSVLAELQRGLVMANTGDGLAATSIRPGSQKCVCPDRDHRHGREDA